ncbi:MAG: sulfite oxidase-like oxidoreductase [Caldiserica bacterium]|nr:MAG: sulfite oxidase-like oxidoreductase [Caldisericota bacterium]
MDKTTSKHTKNFKMPPGQKSISQLPPISALEMPDININKYRLKIYGLVDKEKVFTYQEILNLPSITKQFDIHCVDKWSYMGLIFKGVLPKEIFKCVMIKSNAKFVVVHTVEGYTTELPLDFFLSDNTLLAYKSDGKPLDIAHGYPFRLVVNGKYAYKDPKWVSAFELTEKDIPGYWEKQGYNHSADVFKEERFTK